MNGPKDRKTAKSYGIKFAEPLAGESLAGFQEKWTGVLGEMRRRNKAGRIWLDVPDGNGFPMTVISFWGDRSSTDDADLAKLRSAFSVEGAVWVDWINSVLSERFPAEPVAAGDGCPL